MPRTLPLELQLEILEHALPPPTLRDSRQCRDYLISLALVHRSWTRTALQGSAKPGRFNLTVDEHFETTIQAWMKQSSKPRALELKLDSKQDQPGQTWDRTQRMGALMSGCEGVKELKVLGDSWWECFPFKEVFPNVRRLVWYNPSAHSSGLALHNIPRSLALLSMRYFRWPHWKFDYSLRFDLLTTLLLARMDLCELSSQFFSLFPNLKILAWSDNLPSSPSIYLSKFPDIPLRHLLLEGVVGSLVGVASAITPPLASLTIVNPPGGIAGLEAWCEEEGVELMYVVADREWEFDLEMWAFLHE